MRWLLHPLVGLLLSSTMVIAQAPEPRVTYCDAGFVGPFGQQRAPVSAVVEIKIVDWHALASFDAIISNLEIGYRAAVEYCRSKHPTNPLGDVSASISVINRLIVNARKPAGDGTWSISLNLLPKLREDEQKEAERQQREADEKRQIAEAQEAYEKRIRDSRALFDQFNTRAQIADWPEMRNLLASPLGFRDKVIAFRAKLAENSSSAKSMFTVEGGLVSIATVPASMTTNVEPYLLIAAKLIGVKQIDWKGQTITVPELQYKDGYTCKLADCEDALFWMNPKKT